MEKPQNLGSSRLNQIELSLDTYLESFPGAACVIGSNRRIIGTNSRVGDPKILEGKICYEAWAGRDTVCPFCPLNSRGSGSIEKVSNVTQERKGKDCCIDICYLPEKGIILETIREKSSVGENKDILLSKLSGLLQIGRCLIGSASINEKMNCVLQLTLESLDNPSCEVWAEMDDRVYGSKPSETAGVVSVQDIKVEGKVRGRLFATFPDEEVPPREDSYFLQEAADLIGRQLEIYDLWERLRQSEERYRKLAGNLTKEMWSRTEALAKETGYLEGILRCCDDMIITTDLESRIVEFNGGAEKMLGYTAEEIQGKRISELWVDANERDRLMEEVVLSGGIKNHQTQLLTKAGTTKEISLTLSLLKDEAGRILGTVGVSKDIGRENAIRRELERLNQNYREAIHFINHETKNSLIVMGGFLRRLLQSETDSLKREQLKIVYHHSKFLEAMSRDFLVMAELEHGEFQVRKKHIKNFYKEVILPAMIGLKERYPDSFHSYDASMGGVGAVQLEGDPALLEIVYRNLFGNALKYRNPNNKIAYGVQELLNSYVFNVWNEGPGVPGDQVERIFEKFYRVHDESTRDKRGTGLGLYNIRRIIEAHGGRIWCETRPKEWINFLFELPKGNIIREEVSGSFDSAL